MTREVFREHNLQTIAKTGKQEFQSARTALIPVSTISKRVNATLESLQPAPAQEEEEVKDKQ